jgi:hypothetical protein
MFKKEVACWRFLAGLAALRRRTGFKRCANLPTVTGRFMEIVPWTFD